MPDTSVATLSPIDLLTEICRLQQQTLSEIERIPERVVERLESLLTAAAKPRRRKTTQDDPSTVSDSTAETVAAKVAGQDVESPDNLESAKDAATLREHTINSIRALIVEAREAGCSDTDLRETLATVLGADEFDQVDIHRLGELTMALRRLVRHNTPLVDEPDAIKQARETALRQIQEHVTLARRADKLDAAVEVMSRHVDGRGEVMQLDLPQLTALLGELSELAL